MFGCTRTLWIARRTLPLVLLLVTAMAPGTYLLHAAAHLHAEPHVLHTVLDIDDSTAVGTAFDSGAAAIAQFQEAQLGIWDTAPALDPEPSLPHWANNSEQTRISHEGEGRRCHAAVRLQPRNCSYIREQCAAYGHGITNYVDLYYCIYPSYHRGMVALLALWLALLFVWLGVSASEYFSPNISTLARLLHLPESLAGVSLLAAGNGAPDLSSTFNAVRAGSAALAIGEIVGSASFIAGVVVCATTLAVPCYKVSRLAYLRELCFFVVTICLVAGIVLTQRLTLGLAICMVALYITYAVTVVVSTYFEERALAIVSEPEPPLHTEYSLFAEPTGSVSAQQPCMQGGILSEGEQSNLMGMGFNDDTRRPAAIEAGTRRNTFGGMGTPYEEGDLWDPELLRVGSPSARALGGFLRQHRKSLLAPVECNEIIEEAYGQQPLPETTHRSNLVRRILHPSESTERELLLGRGSQQESTARSGHRILQNTTPSRTSSLSRPRSPWDTYTMALAASPSPSTTHMAPGTSQQANLTLNPNNSNNAVEPNSPNALTQFPQLLTADTYVRKRTTSMPAVISEHTENSLPPLPTRTSVIDLSTVDTQRRTDARPITTHGARPTKFRQTPAISVTDTDRSLNGASVEVGELRISTQPPDRSPRPQYLRHHRTSSCCTTSSLASREVARSSTTRWRALLYSFIPTLQYWLPSATLPLKAFIAFSALPVFILTTTVPVVPYLVPGQDESTWQGPVMASVSHEICDGSRGVTEDGQCEEEHSARPISAEALGRGFSLSARELSGIHLSSFSQPALHHLVEEEKTAAYLRWAEAVASYTRSAMSIMFLCWFLSPGDYLLPAPNAATRTAFGAGIAVVATGANYVSRHWPVNQHALQVVPCLVGFLSGLAWVSLIADEIVSITQALGLMLGLSEEILGLTIVGFGNSLGDLVTNLTLARMGYPMMALSACFGGPMLCLLLGIGIAACGNIARTGSKGGSFEIPMTSPTVIVSTACLLLNSLIFLVFIPRQNYHMTRAVGFAALTVYCIGMAANVYIEW
ncbi:hypothetical protein H4R20_000457 [Coemansia guatemalensis]|uniref:Sodium/calcium exchanger membrane region domain-containing protein n=1 Tax=Coemansia guatemalensis TaxID=2761395 RepID=A0A9W8I7R0_9FUNG|nr:hypothetical protein H4R20_000457 [Coemansia guatemalensis]